MGGGSRALELRRGSLAIGVKRRLRAEILRKRRPPCNPDWKTVARRQRKTDEKVRVHVLNF